MQLANPKAILFFTALVPQFIDLQSAAAPQFLQSYAHPLLAGVADGVHLALDAAGGTFLRHRGGGAALVADELR